MRICVYARSAVDFDAGTSSIEQQKKYTAEYIRKNYPDAAFDPEKDVFCDPDTSGYHFNRLGYQNMKAAALRGEYDVLVMNDIARLGRRISLCGMEMDDLFSHGVRIVCCDGTDMYRGMNIKTLIHRLCVM